MLSLSRTQLISCRRTPMKINQPRNFSAKFLLGVLCVLAREIFSLAYLNGAQGAGVMMVFSCITSNSLVGGGQPSTVLLASARRRSRSPASL